MRIVMGGGGLALEIADRLCIDAIYAPVIRELKAFMHCEMLTQEQFKTVLQDECDVYVCAGKPKIKKRMYKEVLDISSTVCFPNFMAGSTASDVTIGQGAILMPNSYVSAWAEIANFVLINYGATVGHNACIGPYSTISPNATIGGYCKLGQEVFVGAGANIKEELTMGSCSVIGMGAVVLKDIPADHIAIGNPAKIYSLEEWDDRSCKKRH